MVGLLDCSGKPAAGAGVTRGVTRDMSGAEIIHYLSPKSSESPCKSWVNSAPPRVLVLLDSYRPRVGVKTDFSTANWTQTRYSQSSVCLGEYLWYCSGNRTEVGGGFR